MRTLARTMNVLSSQKPPLWALPDPNHSLMSRLAAWWPFMEAGGDRLYDYSGNGNTGVYLNSSNAPWVPGHPKFGGLAFETFGIDELIDVPHSASLDLTGAMTISTWFRIPSAAADYDGLVFKSSTSSWNNGYGIYLTNDFLGGTRSVTFYVDAWNVNHADIAFDWSTDFNWHHVVGVYDKTNVIIYLDLVRGTDDAYTGSATSNTGTLQIGKSRDGATLYTIFAQFYDMRIWNRALGLPEITELYLNPWAPFRRARVRRAPPSAGQTIAVGQVTETDTAQAVAWAPKRRLVAQTTETDISQATTVRKTKAAGQVAETDTAQTATRRKTKALGQTTETDTAQAVTRSGQVVTVGQVVENDTSQAVTWAPKRRLVNQVTESDTVQAVARLKTRQVGQATESDVAQGIGRVKTKSIGQVTESNTCQALVRVKTKTIGQVTESNTCQALTRRKIKAIFAVTETDLAHTVTLGGAVVLLGVLRGDVTLASRLKGRIDVESRLAGAISIESRFNGTVTAA